MSVEPQDAELDIVREIATLVGIILQASITVQFVKHVLEAGSVLTSVNVKTAMDVQDLVNGAVMVIVISAQLQVPMLMQQVCEGRVGASVVLVTPVTTGMEAILQDVVARYGSVSTGLVAKKYGVIIVLVVYTSSI